MLLIKQYYYIIFFYLYSSKIESILDSIKAPLSSEQVRCVGIFLHGRLAVESNSASILYLSKYHSSIWKVKETKTSQAARIHFFTFHKTFLSTFFVVPS